MRSPIESKPIADALRKKEDTDMLSVCHRNKHGPSTLQIVPEKKKKTFEDGIFYKGYQNFLYLFW